MDVEFDSFDNDSSIATLRIKASSQYQHNDEVFLESLMTAVKIEMGLPPAADVQLHVEDKRVHATLTKKTSTLKDEVPNVDLVDVYTHRLIPLQDALMNKPFAILALWEIPSKSTMSKVQQHALKLLESAMDNTHVLALHIGPSSDAALQIILDEKWYFPQQILHHYHLPRASLEALRQALASNDDPNHLYALIDKKRQILGVSSDLSNLDGSLELSPPAVLSAPPSLPVIHTTHDDCHLKEYPNVEVVHLATRRTKLLFDVLTPGSITVIDFWSTTCVRCPAAIVKLLAHHQAQTVNAKIQHVLINTDNADKGWNLVQEHEWAPFGPIVHLHVTLPVKESLKAFMAMKQMPHHVLLDANHHVLVNGKFFSYDQVDAALASMQPKLDLAPSKFAIDDEFHDVPNRPPPPFAAPQMHAFVLDDDF
ncbi:hypothetical protein H310_10650 [Aphanomyces invadans]|uniref:Thioredoxin domain-containing protein n=1 Tax=Aphanomyces invadans TaxID=157072 RepID=A0A024TPC9_9STRA|nr:hypothetical protein H310_10650 [Aphanomyces invadans]ETV95995.1 hypothetical protein H310_10650 [Aphanomyces invadans]|eukprot:XP_008875306.1 hypothetical protein H310_10650 [Aphanomyces invadans]